ncbi:gamma-glutamylcyclotransferase family protein [Pseudoalteromonas sp. SSDWG2]|uniref:gamma-glutamylcyclotransferase family protein n=1 Tax=Pseudoalteromonas sp. SSDWG2 TaxID=3139391 RepID=UPI003BAC58A9
MTRYYFSFGSNMSAQRIKARLPNAKRVGVAHLKGYKLAFDMLSLDGSGKCTIHPHEHSSVYGVVWELEFHEQEELHHIEGPRYDITHVDVTLTHNQEALVAYCYIANTIDKVALPYEWYVQHVHFGAIEANLPEHYVQSIKNQASVEDQDAARHQREMQIHLKDKE